MLKRFMVACAGVAVLAIAGAAFAGVPCTGTSTIAATGDGACAPGAAVCPLGDFDTITLSVTVKDCYGTALSGKTVDMYMDPTMATAFCFCPGEVTAKQGVTDVNGDVSATWQFFGGCGDMEFTAEVEGVTLGPTSTIYIASPDNNADCVVNLTDFIGFAGVYFTTDDCSDYNCDNTVNLTDFIAFAGHYFHACP
jgi:hypothetical protein